MGPSMFRPPFDAPDDAAALLRTRGHAVLAPDGTAGLAYLPVAALAALAPSWDDLPFDEYLKDGGRYRRRRHSCFVAEGGALTQVPHRAHWQPVEYNALHGGMHRWFAPMDPVVVATPAWSRLLLGFSDLCARARRVPRWFVEAHQFRIDTTEGIGRPTPEGAHRDGVDFVAVALVARRGVKGGETRVFEAAGSGGQRFTMTDPWTTLLMDDERVIHETTPIQPLGDADDGVRDTLVLTLCAGGFQGEAGDERRASSR